MHVIVEADGGSRGNPGSAGYGALVRDPESGEVLTTRHAGLGKATNNVAEYSGLIAGLEAAAELGADTLDVRMDSKLVVEQMSGRWKIRNSALRPLALRARDLVAGFTSVTFEWVPRARNTDADRLANEAMDAQDGKPPRAPAVVEAPAAVEARTAAPATWLGAAGTPVRLLLLRHGQTAYSLAKRYSGRGDPELSEAGLWQAEAAAKRLCAIIGVDAVISSPLRRAQRTARIVAEACGLPVTTLDGLTETDFGSWDGLTFAEAARRDPELHRSWLSDPTVPAPGGESFDEVFHRVTAVRDDLLASYAGRTVVVVSHVTPIKSLLRMGLAAGESVLFRLHLDLASLSIVEFYPDGNSSVSLVNDTSHLH